MILRKCTEAELELRDRVIDQARKDAKAYKLDFFRLADRRLIDCGLRIDVRMLAHRLGIRVQSPERIKRDLDKQITLNTWHTRQMEAQELAEVRGNA